jgi:hypothetical protein
LQLQVKWDEHGSAAKAAKYFLKDLIPNEDTKSLGNRFGDELRRRKAIWRHERWNYDGSRGPIDMFSGPEIINNYVYDIQTNLRANFVAELSVNEAKDTSCARTTTYIPRQKVLQVTAKLMELNPSSAQSDREKFINSFDVFEENFLTDLDLDGRGGKKAYHVRRCSLLRRFCVVSILTSVASTELR